MTSKDKTCHNCNKICHFSRACLNGKRPQQGYVIRNHTKQEDIIRFQQECPYFKIIYNFLDDGTLSEDPKRAHAIHYEANHFIMLDGILYHLYQRRMRKKVKEEDII